MLKVAEIRVDGLLLEKRVNSLALRSCSVVPRIPAVAVECGIQTQYYLASPVCIPLLYVCYEKKNVDELKNDFVTLQSHNENMKYSNNNKII